MKLGIIFICHNNEGDIDPGVFIEHLQQAETLELCLVNNDSRDNTYGILQEIKDACKNVSIVNIKKFKTDNSAVRAGARFMFNNFDRIHIGYVNILEFSDKGLTVNDLFKTLCENRDDILDCHLAILEQREIKQTLFQNIFSAIEYLNKIEADIQLANLN
ncbi:MAG: family 2 glycosyl transferase [Bacteroidia bacterium]|nr:family 2 glycosyl transferase [Bacteroidia bacterium]NNK73693.1 family 2 glycosyl transferase [Flavobacteriaceae bacterium]